MKCRRISVTKERKTQKYHICDQCLKNKDLFKINIGGFLFVLCYKHMNQLYTKMYNEMVKK